jgi:IS30 family transposase
MKTKDEVFLHFQTFVNYVETQFDKKIKTLRTDNGTEFVNQKFSNFLKQKGIVRQTTCVYTPQQNGVSERKNRHIMEMTRSLLFQSNVSKIFWSEAIITSIHLINRLPSAILDFKSPYELLLKEKPNIDYFKVFGCTCFVHINRIDKLDFTSIKTIFLGYSMEKK